MCVCLGEQSHWDAKLIAVIFTGIPLLAKPANEQTPMPADNITAHKYTLTHTEWLQIMPVDFDMTPYIHPQIVHDTLPVLSRLCYWFSFWIHLCQQKKYTHTHIKLYAYNYTQGCKYHRYRYSSCWGGRFLKSPFAHRHLSAHKHTRAQRHMQAQCVKIGWRDASRVLQFL